MSTVLQHPIGPYTVEGWLAMDHPPDGSRLELIYGYLHATPPPSGQHQFAAYRLTRLLEDSFRAGSRSDLYVVPAAGVAISTPWRTGLIPDVVAFTGKPKATILHPQELVLVVEVWSPGNKRSERETKMAAYADASIPLVWTVDQRHGLAGLTLTAFRLADGEYVVENKVQADGPTTITAAPVPLTLNLAELLD